MPNAFQPITAFCAILSLAATPAFGQEGTAEGLLNESLRGELSASRIFGSDLRGVDAEEEDSGSSVVLRGSLDYDLDFQGADVTLGYDTAGYFYDEGDRSDRWSNRGSASVSTAISESVLLFGQASYASNISTAESASTDQTEVFGRVQFEIDRTHRLRGFAGYRWREYDFDGSEGDGAFFGAEYRYRIAANHYITAEARRENIASESIRRGYDRTTADVFYQRPLARRVRLLAGATARWWDFDGRQAPTGERLERRSLTPEIDIQYASRPGWVLRGRLQHILRKSNDPRLAEDERRLVLTVGYRF